MKKVMKWCIKIIGVCSLGIGLLLLLFPDRMSPIPCGVCSVLLGVLLLAATVESAEQREDI